MGRRNVGGIFLATVVASVLAAGCSGTPAAPKVDVVAELQKLKIPTIPATFTAQQRADIERVWDGPGQWFVKTGCVACHPVSVYDVKPLVPMGPDLAIAVEEVKSRFGQSLEEFVAAPSGTMQMVFGELIKLTPEQKSEALRQLHTAHEAHQKRKGVSR